MTARLLCGVPFSLADDGEEQGLFARLPETDLRPELAIEITRNNRLPKATGDLLYRGPDFEVREAAGNLELLLRDDLRPVAWCRLSASGGVSLCIPAQLSPAEHSLTHELLPELVVAHLWPLRGLSYLHAAAALGPQGARLFLGPSGRGKSTAAALLEAAGEPLFCADCCAVSARPAWAAAAPWHGGDANAGERVPVHAIFALSRDGRPRRRRLGPAEALTALSTCSFLPRWWPAGLEAGLDALLALARAVPVFELCSEPDERLVQRVREAA